MPLKALERTVIESRYWATQRKKEVGALVSGLDLRDKRILNVGAGRTNLTDELLGQPAGEIVNVDIEHFPNLDLLASATDLPFGNDEFDVVVFLRVLHHINDFRRALEEALRCTKPGGLILLSEPYRFMVKLTNLCGLASHPPNTITQRDIEQFVHTHRLEIRRKWARIFLYYFGYQIQVTSQRK
ncbi:class I SAM-dependent methyltransferase [Candidatus Peregrinibacteria bacterium]|nr:class I SAM-dependent methyltransferase [Candidatus Peregrinibacteria bacterium]